MCDMAEIPEEIVISVTPGAYFMVEVGDEQQEEEVVIVQEQEQPQAQGKKVRPEDLFVEMLRRKPTTKYRDTNIGRCLLKSLTELKKKGKITQVLFDKTMARFDKSICNSLSYPDVSRINSKVLFKARKLDAYKFVEDVWTFTFSDVEFREYNSFANVSKLKITAVKRNASDAEVMICGKTLRDYLKAKKDESDSDAEWGNDLEFMQYNTNDI